MITEQKELVLQWPQTTTKGKESDKALHVLVQFIIKRRLWVSYYIALGNERSVQLQPDQRIDALAVEYSVFVCLSRLVHILLILNSIFVQFYTYTKSSSQKSFSFPCNSIYLVILYSWIAKKKQKNFNVSLANKTKQTFLKMIQIFAEKLDFYIELRIGKINQQKCALN